MDALVERQRTSVLTPASACKAALSVRCSPSLIVTLLGEIVTVGGERTVISAVTRCVVSAWAITVIWAVPAVIPVTTPVDETDATAGLPDRQSTARVSPASALTVAASCRVSPISMDTAAGETSRSRTTGTTVTVAVARTVVSATDTAVMRLLPTDTPVMTPVDEMVATAPFWLCHVSAVLRPGSRLTDADNARCSPAPRARVAGVSVMEPAEVTFTCAVVVTRGSPTALTRTMVFPGVTPVTIPRVFTEAMAGLSDVQRRSSNAPASPATTGLSVSCPPAITDTDCGAIVIDRMRRTSMPISSRASPLRALMMARPGPTAVTMAVEPLPVTSATVRSELFHVTATPGMALPDRSRAVRVIACVAPTALRLNTPTELSKRWGVSVLPPFCVPVTPSAGAAHACMPKASSAPNSIGDQPRATPRTARCLADRSPCTFKMSAMATTSTSIRSACAAPVSAVQSCGPRQRTRSSHMPTGRSTNGRGIISHVARDAGVTPPARSSPRRNHRRRGPAAPCHAPETVGGNDERRRDRGHDAVRCPYDLRIPSRSRSVRCASRSARGLAFPRGTVWLRTTAQARGCRRLE